MIRRDILTDHDLRDAVNTLRAASFGTTILERGTIFARKGERRYGFPPRHGRFSKEAIERAISDNDPNGATR